MNTGLNLLVKFKLPGNLPMKANVPRTRIWRSPYLKSIELVHGVYQSYSSPRHFHEELELNLKQGDGWQFNYRGTVHNVPSDTLVVTRQGSQQ
jgi:hypothetical protein